MKTLVYDCFSGISGDMHIGAMVDVGVPPAYLEEQLARLEVGDEFRLTIEPGRKQGITGTRATVTLSETAHRHHRRLADIEAIIGSAGYADAITDRALGIFREIAVAEAGIHGIGIEDVHFHEVGATDAIVDIVAAALCLDHLQPESVHAGIVEVGGGMVRCEHGLMPVPAPATAAILTGVPCHYGRVEEETTTPTGAAILKHSVTAFSIPDGFVVDRIGYGIGQKDFAIPNVLRVLLGRAGTDAAAGYVEEKNLEIACNLDDMSPEAFDPLMTALFECGAKDVFLTPVVMKKSRPGTKLSVLVAPGNLDAIVNVLIRASTTIGVRIHEVTKRMLPRQERTFPTSFGDVRVKIVTLPDGRRRFKAEHDDVMRIAREREIEYLTLKHAIDIELGAALGGGEHGS